MKRRKRKRTSKGANSLGTPSNLETSVSPSGISRDAENLVNSTNIAIDTENPASSINISSNAEELTGSLGIPDAIDLTSSLNITIAAQRPAHPSVTPARADRRTHPRYEFTAAAEIVAAETGARIAMRVRDMSQQGCYVDTSDVLPLGTVTYMRITKGAQLFEARARVVYSRATKGMGLVFTAIEPERLRILETWLTESRETSWLAANRRRSQRVLVTVPIRVSGQSGAGPRFEEETHTRSISAHGALILLLAQVYRGQRLTLSNVQTKAALECVVAHIDKRQSNQPQVGVEFALPNPTFWHVAFPPKDWTPRHPHAKSRVGARESS
jgi:PilZ domain